MANVNVPASQAAPTPEMGLCRARSQSRQPLPTSINHFQSALRNNKLERGKKKTLATTVMVSFALLSGFTQSLNLKGVGSGSPISRLGFSEPRWVLGLL